MMIKNANSACKNPKKLVASVQLSAALQPTRFNEWLQQGTKSASSFSALIRSIVTSLTPTVMDIQIHLLD
jgi:hypothetical protein